MGLLRIMLPPKLQLLAVLVFGVAVLFLENQIQKLEESRGKLVVLIAEEWKQPCLPNEDGGYKRVGQLGKRQLQFGMESAGNAMRRETLIEVLSVLFGFRAKDLDFGQFVGFVRLSYNARMKNSFIELSAILCQLALVRNRVLEPWSEPVKPFSFARFQNGLLMTGFADQKSFENLVLAKNA
ncbi:hypothetical protein TURU_114706 [Turdus rufiventris]|nr:hypothetical protein TURU_114706 [Turdus rufiventris]